MDAMQFRLDVIANNLANAQTTGFKRSRVNFEDLYYQYFKIPGMIDQFGRPTSQGTDVGTGVRVQSTELDMIHIQRLGDAFAGVSKRDPKEMARLNREFHRTKPGICPPKPGANSRIVALSGK